MWKKVLFVWPVALILSCGSVEPEAQITQQDELSNGEESTTTAQTEEKNVASAEPSTVALNASLAFDAVNEYDVLKGAAKIVARAEQVKTVELLIGDQVVASDSEAPFEFDLDTTKLADGFLALTMKAKDLADAPLSVTRNVIVLNKGEEAKYTDGQSGKIIVGKTGYVDQHLKFHWKMPEEIRGVISLLYWGDSAFKLELAIGTGTCPHSGKKIAAAESDKSPLASSYLPNAEITAGETWFSHVRLIDDKPVLGKETPFNIKTYLLK